jgi:hypothetical protein
VTAVTAGPKPKWLAPLAALAGVAATAGGALLRPVSRDVRRRWLPAVPGPASGVLAAVGGGEVIGHVFGRGLSPWCSLVIGSVFLARLGAELHRVPSPPPAQE